MNIQNQQVILPTYNMFTESLIQEIVDPITLYPVENAQELDCQGNISYGGHIFSLVSAKSILQANPIRCPVCLSVVTSFRPNPAAQRMVDAMVGKDKGTAHYKALREAIRKIALAMKDDNKMSYPLAPSTFVLGTEFPMRERVGDWIIWFKHSEKRSRGCLADFAVEKHSSSLEPVWYLFSFSFSSFEDQAAFKQELAKKQYKVHFESQDTVFSHLGLAITEVNKLEELLNFLMRNNQFDTPSQQVLAQLLQRLQTS